MVTFVLNFLIVSSYLIKIYERVIIVDEVRSSSKEYQIESP